MISSKSISDLLTEVQVKANEHVALCHNAGIDLLIYSTFRDYAAQDALFAQGRTILSQDGHPVHKVTNARGGQSFHQFHRAYDCVPLVNGKAVWDTGGADLLLWQKVGSLGMSLGLEWGGNWISFKEFPHFQLTGGHDVGFYASQQLAA